MKPERKPELNLVIIDKVHKHINSGRFVWFELLPVEITLQWVSQRDSEPKISGGLCFVWSICVLLHLLSWTKIVFGRGDCKKCFTCEIEPLLHHYQNLILKYHGIISIDTFYFGIHLSECCESVWVVKMEEYLFWEMDKWQTSAALQQYYKNAVWIVRVKSVQQVSINKYSNTMGFSERGALI